VAVALRKKNLSASDIQHESAAAGHTSSINSLRPLLREEGFARRPRRRDDERPPAVTPEAAAVAGVRTLGRAPRAFATRLAGLFFFVPLRRDLRLTEGVRQAPLPGSRMLPAEPAVRTLRAKRSYRAASSSQSEDRTTQRLLAAWFTDVQRAGRTRGSSLDLDSHPVPAHTAEGPLEKHDVSRRSRSQRGLLTFLARDASQRVPGYARAGITKAEQPGAILRFVDCWQQPTGAPPAELVFDSRRTTYPYRDRLNRRHIQFLTRRRTGAMLARLWSRPASAWQRLTLPARTRKFRTPKVLGERVQVKGSAGELRQVTVLGLGHEGPTVLRTTNTTIRCPALVTR
jgi:hypothetical protein